MGLSTEADRADVETTAEGRASIEEDEDTMPSVELAVIVSLATCLTEELGEIGKGVELDGKSTSE